jgi:hypothetical protein
MSVRSVLTGLVKLAASTDTRFKACNLLKNARVQSLEAERLSQNPRQLEKLLEVVDHFANDEDESAKSALRLVSGQKDFMTLFNLDGDATTLEKSALGILKFPATAKALLRLVDAVDMALPQMFQVKKGDFVRKIEVHNSKPSWGTIGKDFLFSARPVSYLQFQPLATAIGLPLPKKPSRHLTGKDPILNCPRVIVEEWIGHLNVLSEKKYRLPTELEWERALGSNRRMISVNKKALKEWQSRYANAFPLSPEGTPLLGAQVLNDPKIIRDLMSHGMVFSACDFGWGATLHQSNEYCDEILDDTIPVRVGFRYFHKVDELKKDEPFAETTECHTLFRLVKEGGTP